MKASEFIDDIQSQIAVHGDLEVECPDGSDPIIELVQEGGDDPIFVVE